MRARLGLAQAEIAVELREVVLRDKPPQMLEISPKGTVPVLVLSDGRVLEESHEILLWALGQNDPDGWLECDMDAARALRAENDGSFKMALDRYKYHTRFPEHSQEHYRQQGCEFLQKLEDLLAANKGAGLLDARPTWADIAVFPFIRQFSGVQPEWWAQAPFPLLRAWLKSHLASRQFKRVMKKYPQWHEGDTPAIIDWTS